MLLLNTALDMGLQENGELFAAALKARNVDAEHAIIHITDHASMYWNEAAAEKMIQFGSLCRL